MTNGIKEKNAKKPSEKIKLEDVYADFNGVNFIIFTPMGTIDTSNYNLMKVATTISAGTGIYTQGNISGYWLAYNKGKKEISNDSITTENRLIFITDKLVQRIVIKGNKLHPFKGGELVLH